MSLKKKAFSGLLICAFASPLWAETHIVTVTNEAFFPELTYIAAGDLVEFRLDEDTTPVTVTAVDDTWTLGTLTATQSVELSVSEGMTLGFKNLENRDQDGDVITGAFIFGEAPLTIEHEGGHLEDAGEDAPN